jgi:aminopeptidase-like protein
MMYEFHEYNMEANNYSHQGSVEISLLVETLICKPSLINS